MIDDAPGIGALNSVKGKTLRGRWKTTCASKSGRTLHYDPSNKETAMTAPCCSLRVLIVMVALVALPAPRAVGQDTSRLTFKARVSDLWLQDGSRAKNKRRDDCVEVVLPGRLDSPPLVIPLIERLAADWRTPERALASIRSANTVGQKEWLVENFTA